MFKQLSILVVVMFASGMLATQLVHADMALPGTMAVAKKTTSQAKLMLAEAHKKQTFEKMDWAKPVKKIPNPHEKSIGMHLKAKTKTALPR